MPLSSLQIDVPPYRLSGTVIAALLNDPAQLDALGKAAHEPPYKAPPKGPVLAVRPRHTLAADGDDLVVPDGEEALTVGASLGVVVGRTVCRADDAAAMGCVAGYVMAAEVAVPLASHYRPAVRFIARDGYCPLGTRVVPAEALPQPESLAVRIEVDGTPVLTGTTGGRLRGIARLIADVSDFMTLRPGDVLLLGAGHGAPRVRAGQTVTLHIDGVGRLHHRVVAESVAGSAGASGVPA
ncbi:fumarylacetoacetate hydrolase family protein [Aquabacterium sp. J223]|uniref:fumarylacetoacetate hydrolase family protein n=1 Tax=Aquabacterium sp. J223 TaxID=2898431 RepID=UPI0021AD7532|nr:fumarylacetoacetate hydrolase family protein [Aquabacterium sp. J223]UUX97112.1 fumarylacetoacetate hydrolase family protein [Aquabacterium sp. J223]